MVRHLLFVLLISLAARVLADEPVSQTELRSSVEKALPLLERGAIGHREQRSSCFSCHNQGVPIVALTTARARGLAINDEELAQQLQFIAGFLRTNRQRFIEGRGTGGQVDTAGYALLALEAGGYQPDDSTSAVAEYLLLFQKDRDHWKNSSDRPPSEASAFATNYVGLRGLHAFGTAAQAERIAARREQVRAWIRTATPGDTEDRVFRLLTLKLLDEPAETIRADATQLFALQRDDGGWRQLESMESDAYATATALFALHQPGGVQTDHPAYQRGLRFLLSTQQPDGSWHVVSRSKPFQKYFESGFPHGNDQFISAAASAWAATVLSLAVE